MVPLSGGRKRDGWLSFLPMANTVVLLDGSVRAGVADVPLVCMCATVTGRWAADWEELLQLAAGKCGIGMD